MVVHVAHTGCMRNAYEILVRKSREVNWGNSRHTQEDNIELNLREGRHNLVRIRSVSGVCEYCSDH
jgi:hypothetical protein